MTPAPPDGACSSNLSRVKPKRTSLIAPVLNVFVSAISTTWERPVFSLPNPGSSAFGNVLVVLIEKVVAGKQSHARVEVDTSAGLIVGQPLRKTVWGEVSVSAIGRVCRRNVSQQILRRAQ